VSNTTAKPGGKKHQADEKKTGNEFASGKNLQKWCKTHNNKKKRIVNKKGLENQPGKGKGEKERKFGREGSLEC